MTVAFVKLGVLNVIFYFGGGGAINKFQCALPT